MPKPWTRNQKLARIGLIITAVGASAAALGAIGNWVKKVEVRINRVEGKVKELTAQTAKIENLRAERAGIGTNAPAHGLLVAGGPIVIDNPGSGVNVTLVDKAGRPTWRIVIDGQDCQFQYTNNGHWTIEHIMTRTGLITLPNGGTIAPKVPGD
jgi:hypothetical protein